MKTSSTESNVDTTSPSDHSPKPLKYILRIFQQRNPKLFRLIRQSRWSDVQELLQEPETQNLTRYQLKHTTALHCAIKRNAPDEIVEALLRSYPNAAVVGDKWGATPLHYAVCNDNVSAVKILLQSCRRLAHLKDKEGDTPLNWALGVLLNNRENNESSSSSGGIFSTPYIRESFKYLFLAGKIKSSEIIRALLEADPSQSSLLYDNSRDLLRTMTSFHNKELRDELTNNHTDDILKSDRILQLLDKYSFLLQATAHQPHTTDFTHPTTEPPFLALHSSLKTPECPYSFTHLILRLHRDQIHTQDTNGNFPLHILVSSPQVSDSLYYMCLNCDSKLCKSKTLYHFRTIPMNSFTYDWARQMTDIPINNPILFGLSNVMTLRMILYAYFATTLGGLVVYCHDCFERSGEMMEDYDVLDPVEKCTSLSKELIQSFPQAATFPNNEGRFPLTLALESGKLWSSGVVQDIFKACPNVLSVRDVKTSMFPFMIAAAVTQEEQEEEEEEEEEDCYLEKFTSVFGLLMEDPSVMLCYART